VLGDRVAGDRVRALFVGGARREAEAAEAEVAFFVLRAYGSPVIMAPYIFGFFALRAHGSPAIMAPYFCCARGAEAEVAFFALRAHGSPAIMAPYIFVARALWRWR